MASAYADPFFTDGCCLPRMLTRPQTQQKPCRTTPTRLLQTLLFMMVLVVHTIALGYVAQHLELYVVDATGILAHTPHTNAHQTQTAHSSSRNTPQENFRTSNFVTVKPLLNLQNFGAGSHRSLHVRNFILRNHDFGRG